MMEASRIKQEQNLISRIENQKKQKEDKIHKEGKIIVKKEKEAIKLEILEAEVRKRVRDTYLK